MASKKFSSLALFLALNLLFFALVSAACGTCRGRPNPNNPNPNPNNPNPNPNNPNPNPNNPNPNNPNPNNPNPNPNNPNPNNPNPNNPNPNNPNPNNPNPNNPNPGASCPRNALQLGVCANVLQGLLNVTLGQPPVTPCCTLIQGLADLEAAVCLCTAIRANILGINLNIPISLSLLLNVCSRQAPRNFQCA